MTDRNLIRRAEARSRRITTLAAALLVAAMITFVAMSAYCPWCIIHETDPSLACSTTVEAGGSINGHAWTANPAVKVEAEWRETGEDLANSPDWGSMEEINPFSFPVPEETPSGTQIVVTATNACGNSSYVIVTVN